MASAVTTGIRLRRIAADKLTVTSLCSTRITVALLAPALALTIGGCGSARPAAPMVTPAAPVANVPRTITVRAAGRIVTVLFEDYVAGTAISEVTPVGETPRTVERVYEVQTIVARTYALTHLGRHRAEGFDLCDTTHCQVYEPARLGASRFTADVRRAAAQTAGEVILYGTRPIDALFHADCGGHTSSPEQVWGTTPLPYLRPEPDRARALTHRSWTVTLTREQLRVALNADPRTAVGKTLKSLDADPLDSSGRIAGVRIAGDRQLDIRGDDFRAILNRTLGPKTVQSTRFSIRSTGTTYVLTGTGYGHGIGLCQQGALARARLGTPADTILAGYFPGTAVTRLGGRIP